MRRAESRESPGSGERCTIGCPDRATDDRREDRNVQAQRSDDEKDEEKMTTMANVNSVTDQEFQGSVLDSDTPVLVDFWAEWCVPCHMVSPVVEEIGLDKGEALKVVKLNIDENPQATRTYGVMSIPSLILFKGGEEVARVVGAKPKDAILRDIEPHLA
jgi:thioredoxin 1